MAGNRELVSTLGGYATFADCSRDDVKALVDAGGPFALPSGWPLVQEGIPADACYVLTQGSALVFHFFTTSWMLMLISSGKGQIQPDGEISNRGSRTSITLQGPSLIPNNRYYFKSIS